MWLTKLLIFIIALTTCNTEKLIIIGAGPAGIAIGVRLLQNNFTDFLILEAEDRIGGRINSVKVGNGYVDLGAEYTHGNTNNIVYDLAKDVLKPLSIDKSVAYLSDGTAVDADILKTIMDFTHHDLNSLKSSENSGLTFGEAFMRAYNSSILEQYKNNADDMTLAQEFLPVCEREVCLFEGCSNWNQPAVQTLYLPDDGQLDYQWNGLGFKTIFSILENTYLSQETIDDFHQNKILLNKEVDFLNFTDIKNMQIPCNDTSLYIAEHVIETVALGVMKTYMNYTDPPVPPKIKQALTDIGFSGTMKIIVEFSSNWWDGADTIVYFVWKNEDLEKLDSKYKWVDHLFSFNQPPNNPTVMVIWAIGPLVPAIETLSEDELKEGIKIVLNTFLGQKFTVEEPVQILRSTWSTNMHYWGSQSYDTKEGLATNAREILATSIDDENGIPRYTFVGEATHPTLYGTVHGAIEVGFQAADKILKYL